MHLFLTILGWTLLCLVALLLLLLFCPVWVTLHLAYDKLTVRLSILGIPITVYPMKKRKKEKPEPEPKPEEETVPKKEKKRSPSRQFEMTFGKVVSLVEMAGGVLRRILAALKIRDVKLVLPVHSGDAAETALFYGRFCAFFYGGLAVLQNGLDIQVDDIEIIPDFGGDNKYRRSFYCKIGAAPFIMISVAIYAFKALRAEHIL